MADGWRRYAHTDGWYVVCDEFAIPCGSKEQAEKVAARIEATSAPCPGPHTAKEVRDGELVEATDA